MGKMGSATCMICGKEFPIEQMEEVFTGRVKYRCLKCVADGEKQVKARIDTSLRHGKMRRAQEQKWK